MKTPTRMFLCLNCFMERADEKLLATSCYMGKILSPDPSPQIEIQNGIKS